MVEVGKIIVIVEPYFDFLVTRNDEVMLVILARQENPDSPFLVFDRWKTLALIHDKHEIIKLTDIPRRVLRLLKEKNEIIVTEMMEDSKPVRQYTVHIIYDHCLKRKLKKEQHVLW